MTVLKVSFSKSEFIDGELNQSDVSEVMNVVASSADEAIEKVKKHVNELVDEVPATDTEGIETGVVEKFEYAYNHTNEVTYVCEIDVP